MTFDLQLQKRLAGTILKVSPYRVKFDPARLNDIKAAITKADVRTLISEGAIGMVAERGVSRGRARKMAGQRSKGLRKGPGSREGKATAGRPSKTAWIAKVRAQRVFLKELRTKGIITNDTFRSLYAKSKGGFFRSVRHIKIFLNERELATRAEKAAPAAKTKKESKE